MCRLGIYATSLTGRENNVRGTFFGIEDLELRKLYRFLDYFI
jgi:hypothetical protein